MAATVKQGKNNENSVPEASSDAICLPDGDARITELAYYKAERRGFEPGHELDDWLEAEREFLL
jgi:hypothetical protein